MRRIVTAGVIFSALALGSAAAADPVDGSKLLGAWDCTSAGGEAREWRVELLKDGKLRMAARKGDGTEYKVEGTHVLKGDKLSLSAVTDGKVTDTKTFTIQKLTDTALVLKDDKADKVLEFKRGK